MEHSLLNFFKGVTIMSVLNRRQALQRALLNGKNKQDAYHPFPWYESMRKDAPVSFDEENQV